ncbi:MAG: hypothetical protein OXI22_19020 [Defluviicoccus sp.]|nr:hypothetical protein [Defluviicoccus sp.]MDE0385980.1 hypothetical protein [Defluviicoccus sp.]
MAIRLALICLVLSPVGAWTIYKPARVLAPEWAGVSCVSESICTDDTSRAAEAAALYDSAYAFVASSVGTIETRPRVIFCASPACFRSFGFDRAAAHTVGVSGIVLAPRGWRDYILRHEMIHHLQAERLGVIRQWRMPVWFSEGMAYAFSEDPRPELGEPRQGHRERFRRWYRSVGREKLWSEARKLWP